ncbi:MAG: threonine/serine exporter family protein [Pygmaiobacter sp.]
MEILRALISSFVACFAFSIILNTRGKLLFFAPLGGSICWCAYLLFALFFEELPCYFFATIVITIYSEIMARVFKAPATVFLLVGLLPLVPGGGIYYTMEYALEGNTLAFLSRGLNTFSIAGCLALGILVVSSIMRFSSRVRHPDTAALHKSSF